MLHIKSSLHHDWTRLREFNWKSANVLWLIVYTAVVILIIVSLFILAGSQAFGQPAVKRESTELNPSASKNQLTSLYAQDLYLTGHTGQDNPALVPFGSLESTQTLIESLQHGQPQAKRAAAIMALTQAPPTVVPMLLDALSENDLGVRQGAAQILGARRAPEAEDQLFFTTFDSDPSVRAAAVAALGKLGTPFTLPRLEWLQLTETDSNVRLAARLAENDIHASMAATLGVQPGDVRAVAVASSDGRVYAATPRDLYVHGQSQWERISSVPDVPTALVAIGDLGQDLYLGTTSAGVFHSADGGRSWQATNHGLPAATPFVVTALTVDPDNPHHAYLALGSQSGLTPLTPYGLFESADGGDNWVPLTQWNVDDITTQLIIDPNEPAHLLGLTRSGVWQYPLVKTSTNTP